jgi:hypothetical protein
MADVELTADEIAAHFAAMGDSVSEITGGKAAEDETDAEWVLRKARNVDHLVLMKAKKKLDDTTSIWTGESFTAIDAAIAS